VVVIVVVIVSTTHDDLEGAPRAAETCVGRGVGIRVRAGTASHQRDRLMGGVSGGMGFIGGWPMGSRSWVSDSGAGCGRLVSMRP
jgi:hypothetical protein